MEEVAQSRGPGKEVAQRRCFREDLARRIRGNEKKLPAKRRLTQSVLESLAISLTHSSILAVSSALQPFVQTCIQTLSLHFLLPLNICCRNFCAGAREQPDLLTIKDANSNSTEISNEFNPHDLFS